MSEPVLRRSGRNAAKKDIPIPPPASKKRASVEPKKPVAKKIKTAVDNAGTAAKTAIAKTAETAASSSKTAVAPEKTEKPEKLAKTPAKSAAKSTTAKPAVVKPIAKAAKAKKANEASEGLKDGDFVPKDLPEIQSEDGSKTTIAGLLETAQRGIIIFAYPKASTPGCTTQACLFRDNFGAFSEAGYTVYGLSGDSPTQNEKFKTKHSLTYTLLCDPTYELHEKLSIKKKPKGTIRSVIIIEKTVENDYAGKILRNSPASPQITLQIAKEAVGIDHASMIAAAAEAKEAEKKASNNETALPVAATAVDATA